MGGGPDGRIAPRNRGLCRLSSSKRQGRSADPTMPESDQSPVGMCRTQVDDPTPPCRRRPRSPGIVWHVRQTGPSACPVWGRFPSRSAAQELSRVQGRRKMAATTRHRPGSRVQQSVGPGCVTPGRRCRTMAREAAVGPTRGHSVRAAGPPLGVSRWGFAVCFALRRTAPSDSLAGGRTGHLCPEREGPPRRPQSSSTSLAPTYVDGARHPTSC